MRGKEDRSEAFFSYLPVERRIPADHPLRAIRSLTDTALAGLSRDFDKLYARDGRPSIPPERLLRALLLQAFYTVRSERQLMEQLDYNLLFRWFVGLSADDPVWDATVFCKNRDRLLDGDIAAKFFAGVLNLPQVHTLLSSEHFSVDGTLIEAWASMKSFVPKADGKPPSPGGGGRNAERNFRGEKRTNDTHRSTTDSDARLFRKGLGKEAKLCHMGHVMTENRNNLIIDARLTAQRERITRSPRLRARADLATLRRRAYIWRRRYSVHLGMRTNPFLLSSILNYLNLLQCGQAARHHRFDFRKKLVDLVFGIDDLDYHWQIK